MSMTGNVALNAVPVVVPDIGLNVGNAKKVLSAGRITLLIFASAAALFAMFVGFVSTIAAISAASAKSAALHSLAAMFMLVLIVCNAVNVMIGADKGVVAICPVVF